MKAFLKCLGVTALMGSFMLTAASPSWADNVSEEQALNKAVENLPDSAPIKQFANAVGKLPAAEQKAVFEKAGTIATNSGAPQAAAAASSAAAGAANARTGMGSPAGNLTAMASDGSIVTGASAGEGYRDGFGMWVMPLFKSMQAWDLEAGDGKYGFNATLGGVALGADYSFAESFRVGLMGNFGWGHTKSTGDGPKSHADFNFWGLGIYGGWQQNGFGVSADLGYTQSNTSAKAEMPGGDWDSDILTTAWTAGLTFDYLLKTSMLNIMPHIGVRYTHLTTYGFDSEAKGAVVAHTKRLDQDIWNFPIGVQLTKEFECGNGWNIKPMVDLSIIPAAGDFEKKSKSYLIAGDTRIANNYDVQLMDAFGWEGRAGLSLSNSNVTVAATYIYQGSAHTASHGGELLLRYDF